jgi:hypothetical protein
MRMTRDHGEKEIPDRVASKVSQIGVEAEIVRRESLEEMCYHCAERVVGHAIDRILHVRAVWHEIF